MTFDVLQLPMLMPAFLLVLFRVAGLMTTAPLFGSSAIPMKLKLGLALAGSLTLFPLVLPKVPAQLTLADAVVGIAGELAIGLAIGFAMTLIFVGIEFAGGLVGQQAGIALAQVFNPLADEQTTVVSQLYAMVVMLIFLGAHGHHLALTALLDSFETVPPLSFRVTPDVVGLITALLDSAFALSIKVSGPVLLVLFMTKTAMGFISRTVPQFNILAFGFSIQSAVALAVAAVSLTAAAEVFLQAVEDTYGLIVSVLG